MHKKENDLAELLTSITKYELSIDWQEIRHMQTVNLKNGNNNVGIADIVIVQNCMQNNLKLITNDKHFIAMAKYIPFDIYR